MILTVVTGSVDVAGGAALGADHLIAQVVQSHIGAFLDDDHLNALGVGVREVHNHLAVLVDGNTRHHDVGLALLHSQQRGVEVHVVHDQLQTQLLGDSTGDFHIDALEGAVIGNHLVGREGGVGGHDQLTLLQSHVLGRTTAGQQSGDHQHCQNERKHLFHNHTLLFSFPKSKGAWWIDV